MNNSPNKPNVANVSSSLLSMREEADKWTKEEYARSNDRLYKLLSRAYEFYCAIKDEKPKLIEMNAFLKAQGLSVSHSPVTTRVVRFVFRAERRRAHVYSTVLRAAEGEDIKPADFASWLAEHKGVEEIRRRPREGSAQGSPVGREEALNRATDSLENAKPLCAEFEPSDDLAPPSDATIKYTVALVRLNTNGKCVIVRGFNDEKLARNLLVRAGTAILQQDASSSATKAEKAKLDTRVKLIDTLPKLKAAAATAGEKAPQ